MWSEDFPTININPTVTATDQHSQKIENISKQPPNILPIKFQSNTVPQNQTANIKKVRVRKHPRNTLNGPKK